MSDAAATPHAAPAAATPPRPADPPATLAAARWALLFGNFSIGCGVMVTTGTLNDLVRDLGISLAQGGQLVAVAAVVIALLAPPMAALVAGIDRRRLLSWALLWFGLGHLLCLLAPGFAWLLPLRALAVLGAAVFTPQAAATIGVMAPPAQRGRAITFVFLGWSLASVLGMPLGAWVGESLGWRSAFALVGVLALVAALAVWRALPDQVRPPALSRASWAAALTHPALVAMIGVTVASASGQFTLFAFLAPYYREVLGASAGQISLLFLWFGAVGVLGNVLVARHIDRLGASRAVALMLGCIALSLLLWPLGRSVALVALVSAPWALGCFASNSAQQARLSLAAPALTPVLIAFNTSAMYLGQAIGAASGGALQAQAGFGPLNWAGLAWLVAALGLSLWATGRLARRPLVGQGG